MVPHEVIGKKESRIQSPAFTRSTIPYHTDKPSSLCLTIEGKKIQVVFLSTLAFVDVEVEKDLEEKAKKDGIDYIITLTSTARNEAKRTQGKHHECSSGRATEQLGITQLALVLAD